MYQKERLDEILNILKQSGYVTIKYLMEQLHYSTATINRDLNILEKKGLVKRSYGGVELVKQSSVLLPFRYHKMKTEKNTIAQKAAELVKDGDVIFIDGTTTTEYMDRHLIFKKNITVITNNIKLVETLATYDVNVVCLGGRAVEKPYMLYSDETVENARTYHANKMFFASGAITRDGKIGGGDTYFMLERTMLQNADEVYYLADHEKVGAPCSKIVCKLDEVNGIITDYHFDEETKQKFSNTQFIEV